MSKKGSHVEGRRTLWTNYKNLKSWLDNRLKNLVEFGFVDSIDGEVVISQEQLYNIVNIDETCLFLDRTKVVKVADLQ